MSDLPIWKIVCSCEWAIFIVRLCTYIMTLINTTSARWGQLFQRPLRKYNEPMEQGTGDLTNNGQMTGRYLQQSCCQRNISNSID